MKLTRTLPVVVALTLSVAARADAPVDQYDTFLPASTTITDHYTTLTWTRAAVGGPVTPNAAPAVCNTVALPGKWRLPTVRELLTLVDEQPHLEHDDAGDTQRFIDPNAFLGTPPARFIAASPDVLNAVWFVDFGDGTAGVTTNGGSYWVRCVRIQ